MINRVVVLKAFDEVLKKYEREKKTGTVMAIADISQGTIAKARTRQEKAIK